MSGRALVEIQVEEEAVIVLVYLLLAYLEAEDVREGWNEEADL